MWEVEHYQRDSHSPPHTVWTLEPNSLTLFSWSFSSLELLVLRGEAGAGLLIDPLLSLHVFEFSMLNNKVSSLCFQVRDNSVSVVLAYGLNTSARIYSQTKVAFKHLKHIFLFQGYIKDIFLSVSLFCKQVVKKLELLKGTCRQGEVNS